jgi:hypothetical protein
VERDFRPKPDRRHRQWELFPGIFIIVNAELDRYIRVPSATLEPVRRAIQYYDGTRSFEEIARLVLAAGWKFDVDRTLCQAGRCRVWSPAPRIFIGSQPPLGDNGLKRQIGRCFRFGAVGPLLWYLLTAAMAVTVAEAGVVWLTATRESRQRMESDLGWSSWLRCSPVR